MPRALFLRSIPSRSVFALVALGLAPACRVASAKLWNLHEVHRPDGNTKYTGRVRSDIEHLIRTMFDLSGFRGGGPAEPDEEIEDPLGECLENLIELGRCNQGDPATFYATVDVVTWLATECHYPLSRERCALELGPLARRLEVAAPARAPESPAGVEEVSSAIEDLTRSVVAANAGDAVGLAALVERLEALAVDLQGARRLLSVVNLLSDRLGDAHPAARDLAGLRRDLARRCVAFALDAALVDGDARVRAAALRTAVDLDPNGAPERLDAALGDASLEVKILAVRLLGRSDHPPAGPGGRDAAAWIDRVLGLLRDTFDGELSVAVCKTLGRWTGRPRNLHPEAWVAWWEDEGRPAAPRP